MTKPNNNADLLIGDKLYQNRARIVLPILVRQAKAGIPIYYSDLAEEVDMPNPRNLNFVLGFIGDALIKLSERTKIRPIPVINSLVINKNNNLPGIGIGGYINKENFQELSLFQRRLVVNSILTEVYAYQHWDWVLQELGLEPALNLFQLDVGQSSLRLQSTKGGSGESEHHKDFKDYISQNHKMFGIDNVDEVYMEYIFQSFDAIDVLFISNDLTIGIEVKSKISDSADILRGLFQCVKYKALIEAEQKIKGLAPNCQVYLAIEGAFPKELISVKNQLGISIKYNLR